MSRPTAPGLSCASCHGDLHHGLCRRTDEGWRHSTGRTCYEVRKSQEAAARTEDVRFMAETGECLTGAARRLGMDPRSLESWLRRAGLDDIRADLLAREPIGIGWERRQKERVA